jgi:hypothetical protein
VGCHRGLRGEVHVERVGGLFTDRHAILRIGGRDQTKLIDGVERQVKLVAAAITHVGFGDLDVRGALCFPVAGELLQSARLDLEPPTVVQAAQEAISWLSQTIAQLDEDSHETSTSLVETLARLPAVWTFTDTALGHGESA